MGKHFKDQDHNLSKKRFKKSNLSNAQNVREASLLSAFSTAAINFNKIKNFFWTFNKISKGIKLDPKIITNLETAFEQVSKVHAEKFTKQNAKVLDLQEKIKKISVSDPTRPSMIDELKIAEEELEKIKSEGLAKINAAVDDFNQQTKAPVFLDFNGKIDNPKLDFGILSQSPGDAVDVEALRKALVIMREVNPADADPLKRIMSFFRGGVGMVGDATRPLRNISGDLTIKNLMGKKYTFLGPIDATTRQNAIKEYTLSDILEITAKSGKFSPPAGYNAAPGMSEMVARDFNTLIKRTEVAQSGIKDPRLLSGISILAALFTANLSSPYWVPLVAGIPSMTKRFTDSDGNVKEQEEANEKLFRDNNTTDNNDLDQALKEQINSDIQYYQNKMSTETNPIFSRQYQLELNRLNRKLERLNSGGR
jgi:hypothetical protein